MAELVPDLNEVATYVEPDRVAGNAFLGTPLDAVDRAGEVESR